MTRFQEKTKGGKDEREKTKGVRSLLFTLRPRFRLGQNFPVALHPHRVEAELRKDKRGQVSFIYTPSQVPPGTKLSGSSASPPRRSGASGGVRSRAESENADVPAPVDCARQFEAVTAAELGPG